MGKILPLFLLMLTSLPIAPEAQSGLIPKFDWLPSECAHKQYPMRVLEGNLFLKDGSSLYVPAKAIIDNGWGEIGSTHVVGSTFKSLPEKLNATWFSFAEDKFFTGEFALPYDFTVDLFKKGFTSPRTGSKTTYSRIIIGFGPEGAVSIWAAAERVIFEVGNYRGREIKLPWEAVTSSGMTKADYINGVLKRSLSSLELQRLEQQGVPSGTSDHYSKQYKCTVSFPRKKAQLLWLKTLNGEREYFDLTEVKTMHPSRTFRALPKKAEIEWDGTYGQKYGGHIIFDESEATAAYEQLSARIGDKPMQLQLEIGDDPPVINTSLTDGKYIIRLKKTEVKSYRRH